MLFDAYIAAKVWIRSSVFRLLGLKPSPARPMTPEARRAADVFLRREETALRHS